MNFNYIITIHNSEPHLRYVLDAVRSVKEDSSKVYLMIDGCTDNSKKICDEYPEFNQIILPDVRETKSITTALKTLPQVGYNLILQDDVVLQDPITEDHIKMCYEKIPNIGVLGFRHGSNFRDDLIGKYSSEQDIIQSEFQQTFPVPILKEGFITERQVVYKSPICISSEVVEKLGGYDERFEPIAHDDTEYCIRAKREGYRNFVCALNVKQPKEWGGCRRFPKTFSDNEKMHEDHFNLIRKLYKKELLEPKPSLEEIEIWKNL